MQRETQQRELNTPRSGEVSILLRAWSDGDQGALDRLTPIVYQELRRPARRYMRQERAGHSLQTTALVNEAYLRLVDYKQMRWQNRAHFFAVSAQLMRRILVDHARHHNRKRGAGIQHVSLEAGAMIGGDRGGDLVALDETLEVLAQAEVRTYISEPERGRRRWKGKTEAQDAVYGNWWRMGGERGKELLDNGVSYWNVVSRTPMRPEGCGGCISADEKIFSSEC